MTRSANKLIPGDFDAVSSLAHSPAVVLDEALTDVEVTGVLVTTPVPEAESIAGLDQAARERAGFEAKVGQTLYVPGAEPVVLVGGGPAAELTINGLRDATATLVRAAAKFSRIGFEIPALGTLERAAAGQAIAEGAALGRYRYTGRSTTPPGAALERLALRIGDVLPATTGAVELAAGVAVGIVTARAANVARDLANTPPGHLTATDLADVAVSLGARFGFEVEVFDKQQLIELGCGGLLGVNRGSTEEPRMVKLRYTPAGTSTGHLGLVGKGIMYDSGGISLKPSDPMHLLMKMDMGGAASVLGAFTALRALRATATVTGWLMCTDNMPSGSAYQLGDVLTARNGTTVEVKNTDAEGRLVMMDAIALANEEGVDTIIDIATLTGAALMALGTSTAALFGNDESTLASVERASASTDEQVWRMPLERRYRKQLDSDVADLSNLGGTFAGATTAALFLDHFVGTTPWAHLDIAGTMQSDADDSWRSKGATGFGTRILIDVARSFQPAR
ncbi:leucyl aminopeptidase [Agromyces cerinus]|uniref:Probable cytosol aminopeptidase n=1 Tax=Agromyces cerinus subsp. cerinus TaxID=232089 RepID=A0A1N6G935_9MICO|nr:leucyl aminopeptidase [Agromyces cerinus]SIO03997.1 leucyl aminopeptidase [Agromyces cerinus subsp. cerinus]